MRTRVCVFPVVVGNIVVITIISVNSDTVRRQCSVAAFFKVSVISPYHPGAYLQGGRTGRDSFPLRVENS